MLRVYDSVFAVLLLSVEVKANRIKPLRTLQVVRTLVLQRRGVP